MKYFLRCFKVRVVLTIILISNSILWYYWIAVKELETSSEQSTLTVFLSDFEFFENKIAVIVKNLQVRYSFNIIIYCEYIPYPPLNVPQDSRTKFIVNSDLRLNSSFVENQLDHVLKTKFIAIMPDRLTFSQEFSQSSLNMLSDMFDNNVRILALVDNHNDNVTCMGLKFKLKQWTLQFYKLSKSSVCDYVSGTHIIIMKTQDFLDLPQPNLKPHHLSVYIQSVLKYWKVKIVNIAGISTFTLHKTEHSQWKHMQNELNRIRNMYNKLGIKLVQTLSGKQDWYGCGKKTPRCFGTVINDMPEYIYQNRWTPPCCLKNIRITAKYVFDILSSQGVRYWLEGGSLLGAARSGDIIPWDYDVDIGIYKEDISMSKHLSAARNGPIEDENGFIWEKAREGDFFRVQFSESNHLHVDIFPFYSRNGTMTKDTWFLSHRQDTEFPEHFLKPLHTIQFIGTKVSAPNNWKEFLELKFGKGAIENPKYPNLDPVNVS